MKSTRIWAGVYSLLLKAHCCQKYCIETSRHALPLYLSTSRRRASDVRSRGLYFLYIFLLYSTLFYYFTLLLYFTLLYFTLL